MALLKEVDFANNSESVKLEMRETLVWKMVNGLVFILYLST